MDAAFLQYGKQPGLVGGKFSGGCSAFGGCPRQKENLSVLVGILDQGDDRIGVSTERTPGCRNVGRPLIWSWMDI